MSHASLRIEFGHRSDVGRVRARNEDALAVDLERGWAVLADGMGGYHGGDVASRIAVQCALRHLEQELPQGRGHEPARVAAVLEEAVRAANAGIRGEALRTPALAGMGSTLVLAAFLADCVVAAHVGDSRLYRWRGAALQQVTRDHTMLQELVDGGIMTAAEAARSRFRGLLTRGLGVSVFVQPDVGVHPAHPGDIFLLCSDGLTDMLDDGAIAAVIADIDAARETPDTAAGRLVAQANDRGGQDNISVILARMAAWAPPGRMDGHDA